MAEEDGLKVKNNARASRLAYAAAEGAAGSPSEMEYWAEMEVADQLWYGLIGLDFLERLREEGMIQFLVPLGFKTGEDSDALRAELERQAPEALKEHEERTARIMAAYGSPSGRVEAVVNALAELFENVDQDAVQADLEEMEKRRGAAGETEGDRRDPEKS